MRTRLRLLLALIATLALTASCAADVPGVYRGGQLMQEGPLDTQEHYSYRFVDKWRISHDWLSGPVELHHCEGYPSNSFRRLGGYGDLGYELNSPFVEKEGTLYIVSEHKGKWSLSHRRENIYGTNRDGKFEDFSWFCGQFFSDSTDGLGLYIVKPDPDKGTDEWVEGAQPVTINGLQWLHKKIPMQDWSQSREQQAGRIEYWVLKIPDTQYWMMLAFSASTGTSSKYGYGANFYPEKHQRLLDLFHRIVESVKLEPITPINIDHLLKEAQ